MDSRPCFARIGCTWERGMGPRIREDTGGWIPVCAGMTRGTGMTEGVGGEIGC